jgi:hypothetical protein
MSARQNQGFTSSRETVIPQTAHYSDTTTSQQTNAAHATMRQGTTDHV